MHTELENIAHLHGQALLSRAMRLTGDRARAWDLVQDTYEHALRARSTDVPPEKLLGWLFVIMRNCFIDDRRAARRWSGPPLEPDLLPQDPDPEPEEEPAWMSITSAQVQNCLDQLDRPLRDVYELCASQGISYRDVAARLGVPSRTVGTRLFRARRSIRKTLLQSAETPAPRRRFQETPLKRAA